MEHIPAIHAAKVGMRYPARVVMLGERGILLNLDLTMIAPGRSPTLRATLRFDRTVSSDTARGVQVGEGVEVVLLESRCAAGDSWLCASLPADPAWLTWNNETVRHLARRIRETGETVLLPVLADALEEAGCTDAALLAHCREPQDDARSWAVELLATQD